MIRGFHTEQAEILLNTGIYVGHCITLLVKTCTIGICLFVRYLYLRICFEGSFGIFGQRLYNGHLFHWENMWAEVKGLGHDEDEGKGGGD